MYLHPLIASGMSVAMLTNVSIFVSLLVLQALQVVTGESLASGLAGIFRKLTAGCGGFSWVYDDGGTAEL
jgi:hypothetical protein